MSTIAALNSGVQGMQGGFEGLRKDAHQIATADKPDKLMDVTKPLVDLTVNRNEAVASTKVIHAADAMTQTIGSLLDVRA